MDRNRYVDLLRILAIGGVVYGHWPLVSITYAHGQLPGAHDKRDGSPGGRPVVSDLDAGQVERVEDELDLPAGQRRVGLVGVAAHHAPQQESPQNQPAQPR